MSESETVPVASPIRRIMRMVALVFVSVSACLIVAEYMVTPGTIEQGTLVSAAFVLGVSSSMLSIALLAGRNSEHLPGRRTDD